MSYSTTLIFPRPSSRRRWGLGNGIREEKILLKIDREKEKKIKKDSEK